MYVVNDRLKSILIFVSITHTLKLVGTLEFKSALLMKIYLIMIMSMFKDYNHNVLLPSSVYSHT